MSRHRRDVSLAGHVQISDELPRWKRLLDLAVLLLAVPIVAPIMFFIAVAIKVVSPGPILFKQERIGLNGCKFTCFKFRTMKVNASTTSHQEYLADLIHSDKPMVKMDHLGDDRLIPGAHWIRSTGLDELPQLINVLLGDMTWVGPRPGTLTEYEQYTDDHKCRLLTLPGLTGLWQVSGKNETTFEEMVRLDVWYAKNKTIWMDLKIMVKTPLVLLVQCRDSIGREKRKVESGKKAISLPV